MTRSTDRILTSHVGRLERPEQLTQAMAAAPSGRPTGDASFESLLTRSVASVVEDQIAAGVDIVTDGEFGKSSWQSYVTARLSGWERVTDAPPRATHGKDRQDFAQYYEDTQKDGVNYFRNPEGRTRDSHPVFTGEIRYLGHQHVQTDIDNLTAALAGRDVPGAFLGSVAPGSILYQNRHYPSQEEFLFALADALHEEYKAIVDAGFLLQVDDPTITLLWDKMLPDVDMAKFHAACDLQVEALNRALRDIDPQRVRVHLCWGSWHGPHSTDVPLDTMLPWLRKMNVGGYVLEAGNVRHEHEWMVWKKAGIDDGRILVPGVVSHSTDTIEAPELVAWRLQLFADALGKENIIAGTDCGLGYRVHPQIAWAKLRALKAGADLATKALWGR